LILFNTNFAVGNLHLSVPPGPLSSNNREQVIYTHGAQANSAFHPFGVGK